MTHTQTQDAEGAGTKTAATAWLLKRLKAARSDSEAHPEGHSNRTFYAGQAIAYENVLSFLEEEKPAPAPAATSDVRSLLRTARSGLATYGAGAFEGTIAQIDAILAFDPATPAPAATPGVPVEDARTVLTEACKPWEHYTGEPPDDGSPLSGVFVAGMVYTERLLAKLLDVTHYEGGDGSEDFDNDATQTLRNILTGAGLWDADENRAVKPAPDSTRTGAAETEETYTIEMGQAAESYLYSVGYDKSEDKFPKLFRWSDCLAAMIAARPEAPSDAGWSFDMEAAPRDGTPVIVAVTSIHEGHEPIVGQAFIDTDNGGHWWWAGTSYGDYYASPIHETNNPPYAWHSMPNAPTPPSDPAPSGQAEG